MGIENIERMTTKKLTKTDLLELPQMDEVTTKTIRGGNGYADDWWNGNSSLSFMMSGVTIYSSGGYSDGGYDYDDWLNDQGSDGGYGNNGGDGDGGGYSGDGTQAEVFHGLPGTQYDPSSPEASKMWGNLGFATGGFLNINGVAIDITKYVETFTDVEKDLLKSFGNKVGAAGIAVGTATLAINVIEEGHFDANDALSAAGIGLGVATLFVAAPLAAAGLGIAGLVLGIYTQTGVGDDWVLAKW